MTKLFDAKVTTYGPRLMADLDINASDAAAIFGNLGHESAGFALLQEQKPTVRGSRGGYGWAQWTGSRRRAYELYCKKHNLDVSSDEANYAYLVQEIRDGYPKVIQTVRNQRTLYAKVVAFERGYERAGVPAYKSREQWAKEALKVLNNLPAPTPAVAPIPTPAPASK